MGTERQELSWLNKSLWGTTRKAIITGIIVSIAIPILVSYISFNYQYSNTVSKERKNIAAGFLIDLEFVNQSLSTPISAINDPTNPDYQKSFLRITTSLYPSWGLYYSKNQDIEKLGQPVSTDLANFYYEILTAEDERILYLNYDTLFPIDPTANLTMQNENRHMVKNSLATGQYNFIRDCYYNRIPKLKAELQKIRDE